MGNRLRCYEDVWAVRTRLPDGSFNVEGSWTAGQVICDCGAEIDLDRDVVAWEEFTGKIVEWGPGQGVCEKCHLLYVDDWDGCTVYRLKGAKP